MKNSGPDKHFRNSGVFSAFGLHSSERPSLVAQAYGPALNALLWNEALAAEIHAAEVFSNCSAAEVKFPPANYFSAAC